MSLNKIVRFHPVILTAIFLFFILQVTAISVFRLPLVDRLMISGLISAVTFPIVIFELWRIEHEGKGGV